jgi:lipoate-protein ligase A
MAQCAATGRACAHLWWAPQGLVVPQRYQHAPGFAVACGRAAASGWPVQVRSSGGGLVPQGPGVLNLSLAWPAQAASPRGTEAIYQHLCQGLMRALQSLGVASVAREVLGSFCDGRFNLAVPQAGRWTKLVGTAQSWRRMAGQPVVLAHALMLVQADPVALTAACNDFEAALGSGRHYDVAAVTRAAQAWSAAHAGATPPADLQHQLAHAIARQFAHVLPPREVAPSLALA